MSGQRWRWDMLERRQASGARKVPYFECEVRHHPEPNERQRPNSIYRLSCNESPGRLEVLAAAAVDDQLDELISIYYVVPAPPGGNESRIKIWQAKEKRQGGDWLPSADKVFKP